MRKTLEAKRILASLLIILLAVAYVPRQVVHAASITLVAGSAAENLVQGNVTTITCTLGASAAVGDLVLMWYEFVNVRTFASATDNSSGGPNTWTEDQVVVTLGGRQYGRIRSVITHAGAMQITITLGGGSSGGSNAMCMAVNSTNGWPVSPQDRSDTGSGGSSSVASVLTTGFTTTQASEIVIMWHRTNGTKVVTNATAPLGFLDLIPAASSNVNYHSEYIVTSSTNTFQNGFSWTTGVAYEILGAAYKDNASTAVAPRKTVVY